MHVIFSTCGFELTGSATLENNTTTMSFYCLRMESSAAPRTTDLSSNQGICEAAVALNMDTALDVKSNVEEATSRTVNIIIHMMPESSAANQSTEPGSSQIISDGKSPTGPLNNDTDIDTISNSKEVIFECAYCGTFSKWWREIAIHITERHSEETKALHSHRNVNHSTSMPQNTISEVASSNSASSERFESSYERNKCLSCGKVFPCNDGLMRHLLERYF